MPHLTLEYTDNLAQLDVQALLRKVNQTASASGLFDEGDIKTRAVPLRNYRVGTAEEARAFLLLTVAMSARGAGPEGAMAKALGDVLEQALGAQQAYVTQACVEIVHVDTTTYVKRVIGPAR